MSLCMGLLANIVTLVYLLVILEQRLFGTNKEDEEKKSYEILFHKLTYGSKKEIIGVSSIIEYDHNSYFMFINNDGLYPKDTLLCCEEYNIPDEIEKDITKELKKLMYLEHEDDLPIKIIEHNVGPECNTLIVEHNGHSFLMEYTYNPQYDLNLIINNNQHIGVFSILSNERFVDLCAEICDLYEEG